MWAVFEWENKVAVNTQLTNLHDYLEHLLKSTNMKSLTPDKGNNYDSILSIIHIGDLKSTQT